jgi:hypothetical protein
VPSHAPIAIRAGPTVDLDGHVVRQKERDLDRQHDVLGCWVFMAVGDGARAEQEQMRVRLRPRPDDDRILRRENDAIAQLSHEGPVGVDHTAGVSGADRRHLDDLALDQLDALVGMKDARLSHAVILVDAE